MTPTADELVATFDKLSSASFATQADRFRVLRAAQKLQHRLETPFEVINRLTYQEPAYDFALKTGSDVSLWKYITSTPRTTQALAEATSTDPGFLRRVLRHLAARGTIVENGEDLWSATDLSKALIDEDARAGITWGVPYMTKIYDAGPAFVKDHGYKSPTKSNDAFYQRAFDCPGSQPFENLMKPGNESDARNFNLQLSYYARFHPSWLEMGPADIWFDAPGLGLHDPNAVAVVDLGGGLGVDLAEFRRRYPKSKLPARAILQELPPVIEELKTKGNPTAEAKGLSMEDVELQEYDFFTPQAVKGARVYFMASIIHDWPDEDARNILRRIAEAMTKGHSKLLISDYIIPSTDCKPQISGLDLVMMSFLGSKERPRSNWDELLNSQGLKIVQVHDVATAYKSILEIELI